MGHYAHQNPVSFQWAFVHHYNSPRSGISQTLYGLYDQAGGCLDFDGIHSNGGQIGIGGSRSEGLQDQARLSDAGQSDYANRTPKS